MSGERFTSWLSEEERKALRALAAQLNTSENMLLRTALRSMLFGKPVPRYITEGIAETRGNTSNTSNANTNATGAHA